MAVRFNPPHPPRGGVNGGDMYIASCPSPAWPQAGTVVVLLGEITDYTSISMQELFAAVLQVQVLWVL